MSKALQFILTTLLAGLFTLLLILNVRVYHTSEIRIHGTDTLNIDLIRELAFLQRALSNHADVEMQEVYPEGYVFMNSLYGLTWCNVIERLSANDSLYQKGHAQIQLALNNIHSDTGREVFDETLPLPYGSFYNGWSNFLLGRKLQVESVTRRDSLEIAVFKERCQHIAAALVRETYPASHYGGVWPADVIVCVASLALHDQLFEPVYTSAIATWIGAVKSQLDANGLIPHALNYRDGSLAEAARGSSLSLMLIFLQEVDAGFAASQFAQYEKLFVDTRLGLSGIREYPHGDFGAGDIDSGPVLLQMGGAATIVGMQTTALYGRHTISAKINGTLEALAFPIQNKTEKCYLFGQLPMADAFIAWSHSGTRTTPRHISFIVFHLYSAAILLVIGLIIFWLWRKRKPKSNLVVEW